MVVFHFLVPLDQSLTEFEDRPLFLSHLSATRQHQKIQFFSIFDNDD